MFSKPKILLGVGFLVLVIAATIIVSGFSSTDLMKHPEVIAAQESVPFDIREILPSWLPRGMDLTSFSITDSEMPQGDKLYTIVLAFSNSTNDRSISMTITRRPVEIQEGYIEGEKRVISGKSVYTRDVGEDRKNWTFLHGKYHVTMMTNSLSESQVERFISSIF